MTGTRIVGHLRDTNPRDGISFPGTGLAVTAVFGLTVCGACASEVPAWTGTIEERDGVVHVTNPAEPLWPSDGEPRLRLELEQVFGVDEEPAEAMLARVADVAVDGEGNVYVLDGDDSEVVAFSSSGTVRWRGGGPGEGPGKLHGPRGIVWSGGDRIWLLDKSGTELEWWSTDGDYLDARLLTETELGRATRLGVVEDGKLALINGREVLLMGAGQPWSEHASFETEPGSLMGPGGGIAGQVNATSGFVTAGSIVDYEVKIYDLSGRLVRVIERPGTGFVPAAADETQATFAFMGRADPPFRLPSGRWLVQAEWPTNIDDPEAWLQRAMAGEQTRKQMRRVLDLYDDRGRWLTGRVWDDPDAPEHGSVAAVGPDGKLYTSRSDPFPQARRYRVVIEEPES